MSAPITVEVSKDDDLVFPNMRGRYLQYGRMLTDKFYPMFEKTTVPRFKWRSLRHYAISCWIAAGIKPKTIQAWVGHSTLAMTMDTYGHLFSNDDDFSKAGDAIGKGLFTP